MANPQHAGTQCPGRRSMAGLPGALIIGSMLILALPALAATDSERIDELQRQVKALQNEIPQMDSGMHHSPSGEGLPLHGFMDVGFVLNTREYPKAAKTGFYMGALSLYLSPHFGDNVKGMVEPLFEVTPQGDWEVDVERLQIGYTFNDAATVWAGRFHTPYGYWNTAFHHGAQMQTSVFRPRFLDFEDKGGILPAHTVGLLSTGKFGTDSGRFSYDAYVGNGPMIIGGNTALQTLGTMDPGNSGDSDHSALAGVNAGYEFSGGMNGLRLAVHAMSGNIDTETEMPAMHYETGLNVTGGSAAYITNDWEVMGEYFRFNNKDKSGTSVTPGGTHNSRAGYLQAGRIYHDLTPYIRLEKALLNQHDIYFSSQENGQSYSRQALGLRYYLNPNTALKLELLNSRFLPDAARAALAYRSLHVQYSIGF
ncbi:MAG: hypothetical protein NUV63_01240 [Gallionella sp.]|nr:hypothetical protein [Gallionella sp.]